MREKYNLFLIRRAMILRRAVDFLRSRYNTRRWWVSYICHTCCRSFYIYILWQLCRTSCHRLQFKRLSKYVSTYVFNESLFIHLSSMFSLRYFKTIRLLIHSLHWEKNDLNPIKYVINTHRVNSFFRIK